MPRLLELSIERISNTIEISPISKYYKDVDFATTTEYNMYIHMNRMRMRDIVKSIVGLKPIESFQWLYGRIQTTLAIPIEVSDLNGMMSFSLTGTFIWSSKMYLLQNL